MLSLGDHEYECLALVFLLQNRLIALVLLLYVNSKPKVLFENITLTSQTVGACVSTIG